MSDDESTEYKLEGYELTKKLGSGMTATVYCKLIISKKNLNILYIKSGYTHKNWSKNCS